MNWGAWAIIVGSAMTVAACSKDPAAPAPAPTSGVAAVVAPEETPTPPTEVNIALADMGGEERCKGDAKAAAAAIQASGVNVTLNIVGFTLTGAAVEAELGTLAGSTGGRYYSAQDGAQLSRAMRLCRADKRIEPGAAAWQLQDSHRRTGAGPRGAVDHRPGPDDDTWAWSRGRPVRDSALTTPG